MSARQDAPSGGTAVLPRPDARPAPAGNNGPYPPITVKIATTREEREGAFRLVYQRYLGAGLCGPNSFQMRVTPHHLLSTTTVFVAVYQGEVIFTMSLIGDGDQGVPMEGTFPDEIGALRRRGVRFAEVSCLADRRKNMARFLPVFTRVARHLLQFARQEGLQLVMAVHPKHGRFYERMFGFEQLGGERPYQSVLNKPAIGYVLDHARFDARRREQYFAVPIPAAELCPQPMSAEDLAHFAPAAAPLGAGELLSGGYELSPSESGSSHDAPKSQAATETVVDRPGIE